MKSSRSRKRKGSRQGKISGSIPTQRRLGIEPLENRALLSATLNVPGEVSGDLDVEDFDVYELTPGAGEHLVVQLDANAQDTHEVYIRHGAVPNPDAPTEYDAAGKIVGHSDQFVEVPDTQSGTYYVLVRCTYDHAGSADDYVLRADTLGSLAELEVGVQQEDTLSAQDFDIYQLTPGEGQHLIVQLDNASHQDGNEIYIRHESVPDWTDMSKFDARGRVTGHADQFVEIPETEAGLYFVMVRCIYDSASSSDAYTLRADTLATLPELGIGAEVNDSVGAYDFDIYQLTPGEEQHLIVQLDNVDYRDANELHIRHGAVPDWTDSTKFDAVGAVVGHADQFVEIPQTEAGPYFVMVHCTYDFPGGSDAYALRADTLATLPALEIGVEKNDSLTAFDFDIYQLAPGNEQHLIAQLDSADGQDRNDLYVRRGSVPDWSNPAKYDAAGNEVGYADQFAEVAQTEDDVYFVLAHCTYDYVTSSDEYALRADTLETLPKLEIGVPRDDSLGAYDFDIFQVEPGNQEHLIVQMDNVGSRDANELYIRHGAVPEKNSPGGYDVAGKVAGLSDQFVEIATTQEGVYFVLTHCSYDYVNSSDTYALQADTLATLPKLEIGVPKVDSLEVHDFDIYQLEPGDKQHLIVQFDNADSQDANRLYIRRGAVPDWTDPAKYDAVGSMTGQGDQFVEIAGTEDDVYFVLGQCVYDDVNSSDHYMLRADTITTLPDLIPGVDQPGEIGAWDYDIYQLHVPAGRQLIVELDGADYLDHHELYLRRNSMPDPEDAAKYDAAGNNAAQSDQSVRIAETKAGLYYVMVRCTYDSDGGSDAYTLRADLTPPWPGFGAAGDSLTDEYPLGIAQTWVQLLATEKDLNFGVEADWGPPRDEGYEYNWALAGATSSALVAEGQHTGLAQQMDTGAVSYAVLAIGQNDFAPGTEAYQGIYSESWPQAQIDAFVDGVFTDIETAVTSLSATDGHLILANVIDHSLAPVTQLLYPSAAQRERVSTVLEGLNDRLEDLAVQQGVPLVDTFQLAWDFLGTETETAAEQIGGVDIFVAAGLDPHNAFVDGIHPHTILQGALGNVFLEAFSLGYGLDVSSLQFSEQELLAAAGIGGEYVEDTLTLDFSDYVVLPATTEPIDLGTIDFLELAGLDLSQGDLWYQLTTTRAGRLTAMASSASGSVTAKLYDQSGAEPPLGESSGAEARIDRAVGASETYLLKLSGNSDSVDLTLANLVSARGVEIEVFGTSQADDFTFAPSGSFLITINGVDYHYDQTLYKTFVFTGGAGDDSATLTGTTHTEIGRFFPDHGTFGENGFLVTVNEVATITAHGGGGTDSVFMYDSPGGDEFLSRKGYGKLWGDGFALEMFDFTYNYGYATAADGGNDVAYMEDAPENDKFKFDWPKEGQFFGKMYGGGVYYNRAKNFEQIEATMTEGKNRVRLFDSEGDDVFYGQRDESRLVGTGYEVIVSGYDTLAAYASAGTDVANLEDSEEDDTTRARPHKISLWGGEDADPTYEIMARKFDEYRFEGKHGGYDRAKLHDTALNDHVYASGNSASLYANPGELDLLYEVVDFEWVRLYASTGEDTLEKEEPLDFELVYDPTKWDEVE